MIIKKKIVFETAHLHTATESFFAAVSNVTLHVWPEMQLISIEMSMCPLGLTPEGEMY